MPEHRRQEQRRQEHRRQERYHFAFGDRTPYAEVVALVGSHCRGSGEVVVDLGCGFGAVAEPIRELGLDYLGVDSEPAGVKDLAARSMAAIVGDLGHLDQVIAEVEDSLAGREVAGILMLDSLEHLPNADEVLRALHRFSLDHGSVPLVVSIPNVTHVDVAVKLLLGRFVMTPTGLLDRTHVRFFSGASLDETMRAAGWREVARRDFELSQSDQHFPPGLVALVPHTPIGRLLREVRAAASPGAFVNQFVRAYLPGPAQAADVSDGPLASESASESAVERAVEPAPDASPETELEPAPFLSVLVRTQGKRWHTFAETMLSLAAQDCTDFEVLVLCHDVGEHERALIELLVREHHESFSKRVRLVEVCGGGRSRPLNAGALVARGSYLAVLDDDDVALGSWVGELKRLASRHPGKVLRLGVAEQWVEERHGAWDGEDGYEPVDRPRCPYPMRFDLLEHLWENRTPPSGFALPRSFVVDMGQGWDESLPVLEDWDLLLRAASMCGVADAPVVGALYRRWRVGESSSTVHADHEWHAAHASVVSKLDSAPFLLGRGQLAMVRDAVHDRAEAGKRLAEAEERLGQIARHNEALDTALQDARAQLEDLRGSTSWRVTAPIRSLGRLARFFKRPG